MPRTKSSKKSKLLTNVAAPQEFLSNFSPLVKEVVKDGITYLIGPVILARECVMNGLFYPAEELRKVTGAWDDRVVPVFHPTDASGNDISANSPDVISRQAVGRLYNTTFDETLKALKSEIWIEKSKMLSVSPRLNELVLAGSQIEVSTGLFADVESTPGLYNGKAYTGIARNYRPDHLALLPDQTGACSWGDGAGFPRNNRKQDGISISRMQHALTIALGILQINEQSHSDLRETIRRQLLDEASTDSMIFVEDMFDKFVVYEITSPDGKVQLLKRDYTVDSSDMVTLATDSVPVQRKVVYQEIKVTDTSPAMNTDDQDNGNEDGSASTSAPDVKSNAKSKQTGGQTMDKKERIDALLDNKNVKDVDRATLEGMSDEGFDAFEKLATNVVTEEKPDADTGKTGDTTEDDKDKDTEDIQANVQDETEAQRHGRLMFEQHKGKLITNVLAHARNKFTREQLTAMPFETLENLESISVTPNFGGRSTGDNTPIANVGDVEALPLPSLSVKAG